MNYHEGFVYKRITFENARLESKVFLGQPQSLANYFKKKGD